MMEKKYLNSVLKLTTLFLFLSLLNSHKMSGMGGLVFSSQAYYGFGFPLASLRWDLKSYFPFLGEEGFMADLNGSIQSDKVNFQSIFFNKDVTVNFSLINSVIGLFINFIFWLPVSMLVLKITDLLVIFYNKSIIIKSIFASFIFTGLTGLLSLNDTLTNTSVSRGFPYPFLNRFFLFKEGYSQNYHFDLFIFLSDCLIIWIFLGLFLIIFNKIRKRMKT